MRLGLLPKETNINFLRYHKFLIIFSLVITIFFCFFIGFKGLNLGVDFKGGIIIEVKPTKPQDLSVLRKEINKLKIADVSLQEFKSDNIIQITFSSTDLEKFQNKSFIVDSVKNVLGENYIFLKSDYVGPNISKGLIKSGVISVIFAFLGIFFYVWFRFDWQYGLIGVIGLIHDIIIGLGLLAVFRYEFNVTTIAAVLTILGYSINDTIITFNQVKENIKRYTKEDDVTLLNHSLNDVISRTVATATTVVLVLLSIFIWGGPALTSFSFTLLIGVIVGTYSSIYITVPLLLYIGNFRSAVKLTSKNPQTTK